MGATGLLMAAQGLGAFSGAAGAYTQSRALRGEESFHRINTQMSYWQAEDALKRGEFEATEHLRKTGQLVGSQRATLAGQGVDVNTGTAAQIQEQTRQMGAADAMQIKNNAWREAMGFQVQALNSRMARRGARQASRNTLIGGGLAFARDVMGAAYTYSKGS